MKTTTLRGLFAAALLSLLGNTAAHSWPEMTMRLAPNGTMVGKPGFDRTHHVRGSILEDDIVWLLPPNGRPDGKVIHADDKIARPDQRKLDGSSYTAEFPMLNAAPGDFVALLYTENGHVSAPDAANPGKPINRGTVYLYGTTQNDLSNANLKDIHLKWTADGTGGDGKGRLLATRNYDDGQCHEAAPASGDKEGIITFRKNTFQHPNAGLSCQSDVQIPLDSKVGDTLTVIWVWDWPTMSEPGVAVPPATYDTKSTSGEPHVIEPQLYTGVVDFKIVDPCDDSLGAVKGPTCGNANAKLSVKFAKPADYSNAGAKAQMLNPFLVKVPQAGLGVSAATADPTNIPLGKLIGIKAPTFPLSNDILAAHVDAPGNGPAPTPEPTAAPAPAPTAAPEPPVALPALPNGNVLIVTVTVPETTVFVTRTRIQATSTGAAPTPTAPGPGKPVVSPFLPRGVWPRARA
ncbi:hypothetical protein B0H63DRAFT_27847 [Podospora didyma]|uniref:DUF7492 domain-containing protein n=1 Tax=Podospora didyma TaxID=330526 RepID=A0AAE0U7K6_9PEZI|nr:hypothetical protein B0H63DRAFT_27847 [Podospora didyma]